MKKRKSFIFTNKKNSNRAVMAVILGIISLVSLGTAVIQASGREGEITFRYGMIGILAVVYSVTGLILGLVTAVKPDYYKVFPVLAVFLNLAALGLAGLIIYMGVYM